MVNSITFMIDLMHTFQSGHDLAAFPGINLTSKRMFCFSSHLENSLSNPVELYFDPGNNHFTHPVPGTIILRDDGWVVGPHDHLLFWVPPNYRPRLYLPSTMLIIPGGIQLDLSHMEHGRLWHNCYRM